MEQSLKTIPWPENIALSLVARNEFWQNVETHLESFFDEKELIIRSKDFYGEEDYQSVKKIRKQYQLIHDKYFLLRDNKNNLVGWSWGHQYSPDTFYMVNSAIVPNHRRKGFYSNLLKCVVNEITKDGFDRIFSRHNISNNAVIIPKLKCGFKITSFEVNECLGTLVHLTYFHKENQKNVFNFRTGFGRPDEETKNLLNIK